MKKKLLLPWEIHPVLVPRFLVPLANIAWDVQVNVAKSMLWKEGDDLWVAGCRAYKWRIKRYSEAARAELADWLSAGWDEGHFLLKVRGIPIRVYRPPAEGDVPERYVEPSRQEKEMLQTAFALYDTPTPDSVFRLEVSTTDRAQPILCRLVQVDKEGEVHNPYVIPRAIEVNVEPPMKNEAVRDTHSRPSAIIVPPAPLKSRREKEQNKDEGSGA